MSWGKTKKAETSVIESDDGIVIGNRFLSRTFDISNKRLRTTCIENHRSGRRITVARYSCEFIIHLADGARVEAPDCELQSWEIDEDEHGKKAISFHLRNESHRLLIDLRVELGKDDFYIRKRLTIRTTDDEPRWLDRIELEILDTGMPCKLTGRSAEEDWKASLGQPVYAYDLFVGVEFPASDNRAERGRAVAGYDLGRTVDGTPYVSHSSVCGVAVDSASVTNAFLEYIDRIRCRPARLHCQYNSWWDLNTPHCNADAFEASVRETHAQLHKRGAPSLDSYMLDHGWWTHDPGPWHVDREQFPGGLGRAQGVAEQAGAQLGLWLSPASAYGQDEKLSEQGYEVMAWPGEGDRKLACLAGPRHADAVKEKLLSYMSGHRVNSWKLDGWVYHPCDDPSHGHPVGKEGRYYLTAAVETWMQIAREMREQDPDVFINITSGTWLSPWFLMNVDAVWLNNCGDQGMMGEGLPRDQELTYRDDAYDRAFRTTGAAKQFPLSSVYQIDPIKQRFGPSRIPFVGAESLEDFQKYLFMCLSRGSQLVELGIAPSVMNAGEWDVLAAALKWARKSFAEISRARMIGGKPSEGQVYGYSGWTRNNGVISLRNPSSQPQAFHLCLNRFIGVPDRSGPFKRRTVISSAKASKTTGLAYGATLSMVLQPFEVVIWEFTTAAKKRKKRKA